MRQVSIFRAVFAVISAICALSSAACGSERPPNILFAISDDQSWLHAGAYGDDCVKTPAFDRIARDGVRFTHAYVACGSCTPSRSAILTGQAIWRLEEGAVLWGALPSKFKVFPRLLEQAGYFIGHTGKAWGPGSYRAGGWDGPPSGKRYDKVRTKRHLPFIGPLDYAANFKAFLNDRPEGKPFCFWLGTTEPHRPYAQGVGVAAGKRLEDARLPGALPDSPETRGDILDYYTEIEHFDRSLAKIIQTIEEEGELDNTLVLVTSDNGMCFPRGKANLYDVSTRVPLAICWPSEIRGARVVDDFVSLTDIAPTILNAAGVPVPEAMTGRSLLPLLRSGRSGRVEPDRDFIITAHERHTLCRPGNVGYPMRGIRTYDYMYIRNYEPDRWPAGNPEIKAEPQGAYGDISRSPTKEFMIRHRNDPDVGQLFAMSFGKRPAEELYDMQADPDQLRNLAREDRYVDVKRRLAVRLHQVLSETGDPRLRGRCVWDTYRYYGEGGNAPPW